MEIPKAAGKGDEVARGTSKAVEGFVDAAAKEGKLG
jgi:hypothetical protein